MVREIGVSNGEMETDEAWYHLGPSLFLEQYHALGALAAQ
jgi:hypothetical protein